MVSKEGLNAQPVDFQIALNWAKSDKREKSPDYGILYIVAAIILTILVIWILVIVFSKSNPVVSEVKKTNSIPSFVPLIPTVPVNVGSAISVESSVLPIETPTIVEPRIVEEI